MPSIPEWLFSMNGYIVAAVIVLRLRKGALHDRE
jgi:hypothetical protein